MHAPEKVERTGRSIGETNSWDPGIHPVLSDASRDRTSRIVSSVVGSGEVDVLEPNPGRQHEPAKIDLILNEEGGRVGRVYPIGLASRVTEGLDTKAWVPTAGEGCLVLLSRSDHPERARWSGLDNASTRTALFAERAALAALGASADGSVGILGMPHGRWIRLWGMVASGDGRHVIRGDVTAPAESPQAAGRSLADLLLARGAGPFIRETAQ